jgi:16S rRNA processing protein RimM
VARLVGTFGVRGELKCAPTPAGETALAAGRDYRLGPEADAGSVRCSAVRRQGARIVIALDGVGTAQDAQAWVGRVLFLERAEIRLGPDEYLDEDLIGMRLCDERGNALGSVTGVEHYPAGDCLVVAPRGALVPLVKAFVRSIDVAAGTIVMDLPAGLLEEEP